MLYNVSYKEPFDDAHPNDNKKFDKKCQLFYQAFIELYRYEMLASEQNNPCTIIRPSI